MEKEMWGVPIKKVVLATLVIWLAVALLYVPLDQEEARFLQHHAWARVLVVFFTALLVTDYESKYSWPKKILLAGIITGLFYLSIEL